MKAAKSTPRIRRKKCQQMEKKFNWRGNRPRMGKRAICGICGALKNGAPSAQCPACGQVDCMHDVSYDN